MLNIYVFDARPIFYNSWKVTDSDNSHHRANDLFVSCIYKLDQLYNNKKTKRSLNLDVIIVLPESSFDSLSAILWSCFARYISLSSIKTRLMLGNSPAISRITSSKMSLCLSLSISSLLNKKKTQSSADYVLQCS